MSTADKTSRAEAILVRSRRADRGSRIAQIVAEGISSDDDIAEFFNIKPTKKKKKQTNVAADTTPPPGDASASSSSDGDGTDDTDDTTSDDSTFSSYVSSANKSDKLDSDFGDEEIEGELDSDASSLEGDADVRRQERAEARKARGRKERVMLGQQRQGETKKMVVQSRDVNNATNASAVAMKKRPELTTTQEERMAAAAQWAVQQTEALQQREALYNDAERVVRERALQAMARRRRRGRMTATDDGDLMEMGPRRPVYLSNATVLEETGFSHVLIYPTP